MSATIIQTTDCCSNFELVVGGHGSAYIATRNPDEPPLPGCLDNGWYVGLDVEGIDKLIAALLPIRDRMVSSAVWAEAGGNTIPVDFPTSD